MYADTNTAPKAAGHVVAWDRGRLSGQAAKRDGTTIAIALWAKR